MTAKGSQMLAWRGLRILACCLAVLTAGFVFAQAGTKSYVVAVNHAPPYRIIQSRDGVVTFSGIYIEVAKAWAHQAGLTLKFVEVPFSRALAMMEAGTADIMLGPNRTPEREQFMAYLPTPIDKEPKIFVVGDTSHDIRTYADLTGRTIGVLDNSVYFDRFDTDKDLHKIPASDYDTVFKMLSAKRFDAAIAPERLGRYKLRSFPELAIAPYKVEGRPSYFAVSRKSDLSSHLDRLDGQLKALVDTGKIEMVLAAYE